MKYMTHFDTFARAKVPRGLSEGERRLRAGPLYEYGFYLIELFLAGLFFGKRFHLQYGGLRRLQ